MRRYYITRSDLKHQPKNYKVTGNAIKSTRMKGDLWRSLSRVLKDIL